MISFEGHINGNKPVIVDFFAEWCRPCKMMEPVLHNVKERIGDRAIVLKLDIDKTPYYSQLYNIRSVPTLLIFKNGKIVWRKSEVAPSYEILEQINLHLS